MSMSVSKGEDVGVVICTGSAAASVGTAAGECGGEGAEVAGTCSSRGEVRGRVGVGVGAAATGSSLCCSGTEVDVGRGEEGREASVSVAVGTVE